MRLRFRQVFLYIYIFYFLYAPRPGNSDSLLFSGYVLSGLLLLFVVFVKFDKVTGKVLWMLRNKRVFCYLAGIAIASLYYMFCVLLMREYYNGLQDLRIVQNGIVFLYMLHALVIAAILRDKGYSLEDALKLIFRVAAIQGMICVLMFLVPSIKSVANMIYASYSGFQPGDYIMLTRIYGLSCDYTYGMPIIHGVMSAICFFFSMEKDRKYFICFPFIFIVAALNSRTGLLVGGLGVFFALVYYFVKHRLNKSIMKTFLMIAAMLIVIILVLCSNEFTYRFLSALFREAYEFLLYGNKTGTIEYLLDSHMYFPDGLGFVFGEGHRVYGSAAEQAGYLASDIGFVNDMFMGGVIYCIILYGSILHFIMRKTDNEIAGYIQFTLVVSWLIANLKGQVTVNYSFSVMLILFGVFLTFLKPEKRKCTS